MQCYEPWIIALAEFPHQSAMSRFMNNQMVLQRFSLASIMVKLLGRQYPHNKSAGRQNYGEFLLHFIM